MQTTCTYLLLLGLFFLSGFFTNQVTAQDEKVFPFYRGKILEHPSSQSLPGAHVVNKKLNRGTVTNPEGLFSITGNPGDSLEISMVGYITRHVVFPDSLPTAGQFVVHYLRPDTLSLKAVPIVGLSPKAQFRKDFIEMEIPKDTVTPPMPMIADPGTLPSGGGAGVVVTGAVSKFANYLSKSGTQHRKMRKARRYMARRAMEVEKDSLLEPEP